MIVSITTNREEGGLASSLVSYSKALKMIDGSNRFFIPEKSPHCPTRQGDENTRDKIKPDQKADIRQGNTERIPVGTRQGGH